MSWLAERAIGIWDHATSTLGGIGVVCAALLLVTVLYQLRHDLAWLRRTTIQPLIFSMRRAAFRSWINSGRHALLVGRRWNEITLFTPRNAPSRVIFGIIGGAMIYLSMRLSYTTLLPFVQTLNEIFEPINGKSPVPESDPGSLTLLMIVFDAIVGFVFLEIVSVTDIMSFSRRFDTPWKKAIQISMAIGLFAFLGLLGSYEAAMSDVHDTLAFENACLQVSAYIPRCKNFPGAETGGPMDKAPATPNVKQLVTYAERRIAAIEAMQPYEHTLAFAMPFILMIVGLAFDFFEELHLPMTSMLAALFFLFRAIFLFALFVTSFLASSVASVLFRIVVLPASLFGRLTR